MKTEIQTAPTQFKSLQDRFAELTLPEKNRVIDLIIDYTEEPEQTILGWLYGQDQPGEMHQIDISIILKTPRKLIFKTP